MRDVVQNGLQLMAMFAMEPVEFGPEDLRDEAQGPSRRQADGSKRRRDERRARQYVSGWVEGERISSYRDAPEVAPDSQTETFVALKLAIDSWRWAGVPFYLRTGKVLPSRVTEIAVQFRRAPLALLQPRRRPQIDPNVLAIRVQPDEGILLRFGAKVPGQGLQIRNVNMDFRYGSSFAVDSPDAYETLLIDAMIARRQPLHARRRGRARGRSCSRSSTPRAPARPVRCTSTRPGRGGRPRPMSSSSATDERGASHERLEPTVTEEQAVHKRLMQFGEHASLATPLWEERDTSVRAIAAHLASLWDPPARSGDRGDPLITEKGCHTLASVLNLIVTVNDDAAADGSSARCWTSAFATHSRAIVLVPQPGPGTVRSTLGSARIATTCRPTANACATRRSS